MIVKKQTKQIEFENFKLGYPIEKPVQYTRLQDIKADTKIKARLGWGLNEKPDTSISQNGKFLDQYNNSEIGLNYVQDPEIKLQSQLIEKIRQNLKRENSESFLKMNKNYKDEISRIFDREKAINQKLLMNKQEDIEQFLKLKGKNESQQIDKKIEKIRTRNQLLRARKQENIVYNMEKFGGINKQNLILKLRELFRSIKSKNNPDFQKKIQEQKMYWKKRQGYCESPEFISRKSLLQSRKFNSQRNNLIEKDEQNNQIDPFKEGRTINLKQQDVCDKAMTQDFSQQMEKNIQNRNNRKNKWSEHEFQSRIKFTDKFIDIKSKNDPKPLFSSFSKDAMFIYDIKDLNYLEKIDKIIQKEENQILLNEKQKQVIFKKQIKNRYENIHESQLNNNSPKQKKSVDQSNYVQGSVNLNNSFSQNQKIRDKQKLRKEESKNGSQLIVNEKKEEAQTFSKVFEQKQDLPTLKETIFLRFSHNSTKISDLTNTIQQNTTNLVSNYDKKSILSQSIDGNQKFKSNILNSSINILQSPQTSKQMQNIFQQEITIARPNTQANLQKLQDFKQNSEINLDKNTFQTVNQLAVGRQRAIKTILNSSLNLSPSLSRTAFIGVRASGFSSIKNKFDSIKIPKGQIFKLHKKKD